MKCTAQTTKNITIRLPAQDYERIKKYVGPYGKITPLVQLLVKEFLQKKETKAS